ncbi:MAG: cation/multidrug efflux pump [Woeseiaceae bacterium]|nr:cation/multidrug efflux pump [Woeseiaceae bacterium]
MNALIGITALFGLLALFFVVAMLRHLRRKRIVRAGGSLAGGAVTGAVGGAGFVLLSSVYSYNQLTDEQNVAMIEFSRQAPGEYIARLMIDGKIDQELPIAGDEWQLDARVVTWKPPVTILGLEPIYQLERLSGRYTDVNRERSEPRTVHSLAGENPLDVWAIARRYPALTPGVDAYYGTATYVPMADGARFEVSLSRDALIARPVNEAAQKAVGNWQQPQL